MFEDGQGQPRDERNNRVYITNREIYDMLQVLRQDVWRGTSDVEDVKRDIKQAMDRMDKQDRETGKLRMFVYTLTAGVVAAIAGIGIKGWPF